MKRLPVTAVIAAVVYIASWVTPVLHDKAGDDVFGWDAFRFALMPVWPWRGMPGFRSILDFVGVLSAMTNVLVPLAIAWLASTRKRGQPIVFATLIAAAAVNTVWTFDKDVRESLFVGYFLWWSSFVVLAAATRPRTSYRSVPAPVSP